MVPRNRGIIGSSSVHRKAPMRQLHSNPIAVSGSGRTGKQTDSFRRRHPYARKSASGRVLTSFGRVGTVGMERSYSWSFVPFQGVIVSILNFQPTEQPTRTEHNPTDFCGGTAQLDPKTGVPSRGQRVLLTQRMNFHANIPQGKRQSRRCEPSKSHLLGKSRGYDIAIAARQRLLKFL